MRWIIFVVILMSLIGFSSIAFSADCGGGTPCNCGDYLVSDHVMNYDLLNCGTGSAIRINTDGVDLDCDGHTISGDVFYHTGVFFDGCQGGSIKNCELTSFSTAISVYESSDIEVLNNHAYDNQIGVELGVTWASGYDNIVGGNTFERNTYRGLSADYYNENRIYGSIIENNTFRDNPCFGMGLLNVRDTVINNNYFDHNSYEYCGQSGLESAAIGIDLGGNIEITNNEIINGHRYGVFLIRTNNANVLDNVITDSYWGINIESGSNHLVFERNDINRVQNPGEGYGFEIQALYDDIVLNDNTICGFFSDLFCHGTGTGASGTGNVLTNLKDDQNLCAQVLFNPCYSGEPECGNGVQEEGEDCDQDDLGGETCVSQGYEGGELACDGDCTFNFGGCSGNQTILSDCGDGVINGTEQCDCGDPWNCTTGLDGKVCTDFGGFDGGNLSCYPPGNGNECQFDFSNCEEDEENGNGGPGGDSYNVVCGDGIINYDMGEFCDTESTDYSHCYDSDIYQNDPSLQELEPVGCEQMNGVCSCSWGSESGEFYSYGNCYCPAGQTCDDGIGIADKYLNVENLLTGQIDQTSVGQIDCDLALGMSSRKAKLELIDYFVLFLVVVVLLGSFIIINHYLKKREHIKVFGLKQ